MIGELIAGKYRVESELGQGGMGAVYRARTVRNARPVAIKVLRGDIVGQPQFETRFETEVLVTARIKHENIVEVLDHGYLDDGRLYLVLELLTGRSLGEVMLASDSIEWKRALRITREVALALGAVHAEGIVHRDIKPENIFLLPQKGGETVKLMDFGLAKSLVVDEEEVDAELTQPGFAIGTPTYMAPERVTGDYDFRSDLYGLAVVAYQMFVGNPPFEGDPTDILKDHLTKEPVPPTEANPKAGIPTKVEQMLTKALAKRMEHRFQTAEELVRAIDLALDGEYDSIAFAPAAPEWSTAERIRNFLSPVLDGSPQTKLIAGLGAVLLLVVVASTAVLVTRGDSSGVPAAAASPAAAEEEEEEEEEEAPGVSAPVDTEAIAKLAAIEAALAENGFVAAEGSDAAMLPGARLCNEGLADGLTLRTCVYASAEEAASARSTAPDQGEATTRVIVANQDAVLWIEDHSAADPEGRRIQQMIESFKAIE